MANDRIVALDTSNFESQVLKSQEPVLVDFWAPWCGPCRMIAPIVEEMAGEYDGRLKVGKLNVDENGPIAAKYGVMSIPTLILYKDGEPAQRIVGFQPKKDLKAKIENVL